MKKLIAVAAIVPVLLATACAQVTVERTGQQVVVNATGSVLGYSVKRVINRAHEAKEHACKQSNVHLPVEEKVDAPGSGTLALRPLFYHEIPGLMEAVKKTAEEAKGLLDVFGSHGYSVTLDCPKSAESTAQSSDKRATQ